MVFFLSRGFARTCVFATICVVALFLSFSLLPAAKAGQACLRIALPESASGPVGPDVYRAMMQDAGLCVEPMPMPHARAFMAMRYNKIDGVFAMLEEFEQSVGTPVVKGSVLVGAPDGVLVIKRDGPRSVAELSTEDIGVWLGAAWSESLLADYEHAVRVPGGPRMMYAMLLKGRLDGMLLNAFSLDLQGGVPEGFVSVPVTKLAVYSWLRAEHAGLLAKFDIGTAHYREKILDWYNHAS